MTDRPEASPAGPALVGAHERRRLAALLSSGSVERQLDAWAEQRGLGRPAGWHREYGRLRPGRSPWAVLAYAAEGLGTAVRVDVTGDPELDEPPTLTIADCRDDPALPGLGPVLDALPDPVVVRYRPGNRCTVRGGTGADIRFVKVVAGEPDRQVDARALWAASVAGVVRFAVAEPCGWDLRTRSTWYGEVVGQPIAGWLLGTNGARAAASIGTALGELARAPLQPVSTQGPADQLARTDRAIRRAAAAVPALRDELDRARVVLGRCHDTFVSRPLVPVHGAPHMHQWLVDAAGRLGLVDLDRYARGEPELDLATFLVELESESERSVDMVDLERALVDAFEATAGPIDRTRLRAYSVHKRLAKVTRTAIGLRPDGDARAVRHLAALADDVRALDPRAARAASLVR